MRISSEDLKRYREAMEKVGSDAAGAVREAVSAAVSGGASVSESREAAIAAITRSVGIHGDRAQAMAALLYDSVCDAESLDGGTYELYDDIIDYSMMEEKVRWLATRLTNGDENGFLEGASALAEAYAWRCNRTSMVRNCERAGIRYARIPTSAHPCEWCVMLASRGFVYHTADDAEAGGHVHCKCIVTPGGPNTKVEGYDPDALYDEWRESGFMPPMHDGGRIVPAYVYDAAPTSRRRGGGASAAKRAKTFAQTAYDDFSARVSGASSMAELQAAVDAVNADERYWKLLTDRQRQGLQWAVNRQKNAVT